ncbi:hypothetical protein S7711_07425 [Stachybotrys chartarum IBT 7711]|uniref:RNA polymerase II assembly factor Rtp1 C-terminal domain-containing protein n=1 Tax=Stachybotrys chartarum (strain CBS 109288 / IBT 7711) TaxID=1280523 RepID=A0A084AFI4_STACB|nr:hypothetical protein S7711_07425 [Stachybotrys chartarum IBT 7711]
MTDQTPAISQHPEPKLIESIVEIGKKAFDPAAEAGDREAKLLEFNQLIERTGTWQLILALNALIKPNVLAPWLKEPLMRALTRLPLRPDGVRATMEFVFSVHPSSGGDAGATAATQKQGASITHEATAVAAKLLSSVPASMEPGEWFTGISGQLFRMIDGDADKDLARPAAQIVGYGILGKKQYGAPGKLQHAADERSDTLTGGPGTAGWNAFVQPLIESVNPSLRLADQDSSIKVESPDDIIDLAQDRVLVTSQHLAQSLQRLKTLIASTPSPGLCRRVLGPIIPQLWALTSWIDPPAATDEQVCRVARMLLHTYLQLFGKVDSVTPLISNILCQGSVGETQPKWIYRLSRHEGIEVVAQQRHGETDDGQDVWGNIDQKTAVLADLLTSACSKEDVSSIFLHLLQGWIQSTNRSKDFKLSVDAEQQATSSPQQELAAVTLLQKLMEKAPEQLIGHFDQLIELVCQVLKADRRSAMDDEIIAIVLSLLNLVITAPRFQKTDLKPDDLKVIEESLEVLSKQERADVSLTARNLAMLLRFRDEMEDLEETSSAPSQRHIEDRRTYSLAMSYITGSDNPPPVVSEGINLLSGLILAQSPILDLPAVNVLMSSLLSQGEDFINLRVIKVFTQLADKHPRSTVKELLDHYLDPQEKSSTDVRLRFGEALLQVIERLGDTFSGEVATQACEILLSIAGRRGYRPKTLAKQTREEKLQKLREGRGPSGGARAEDNETEEELDDEEQARNDIMAQIVQGWESKRGSEDVRMRTSALSIFGSALEVNIAGIGPTLVSSSVDLCVNILTLETELEKGILRRAAVIVILGFVRALDKARKTQRSLGFGLTGGSREDILRTLQYVAATDNDGLVQQHAMAVIESLENWQMATLLPRASDAGGPMLTRLAGLRVNPESNMSTSGSPRPRIEEIE